MVWTKEMGFGPNRLGLGLGSGLVPNRLGWA